MVWSTLLKGQHCPKVDQKSKLSPLIIVIKSHVYFIDNTLLLTVLLAFPLLAMV